MDTYERELLKGSTDCLILSVLSDHPTYGYELIPPCTAWRRKASLKRGGPHCPVDKNAATTS